MLIYAASVLSIQVPAYGLQSGGVEVGEFETGSVVGQPFKELPVNAELFAICLGGEKVWYPPLVVIDLSETQGHPVVIRITNNLPLYQDVCIDSDERFASPTSLRVKVVLRPGETKYIGIPTSDLTYVTSGDVITFKSCRDPYMLGGQLLLQR